MVSQYIHQCLTAVGPPRVLVTGNMLAGKALGAAPSWTPVQKVQSEW